MAQVEDMCPICHEEEGTGGDAIVVKCCEREFHLRCLLEWTFGRYYTSAITCPICRRVMDENTFGEVVETRTRQMGVL